MPQKYELILTVRIETDCRSDAIRELRRIASELESSADAGVSHRTLGRTYYTINQASADASPDRN